MNLVSDIGLVSNYCSGVWLMARPNDYERSGDESTGWSENWSAYWSESESE